MTNPSSNPAVSHPGRRRFRMVFAALLLAGSGCVTETLNSRDDALAETKLIVTRAGSDVNLSWNSSPGLLYTVYYNDSKTLSGQWTPLPQGVNIRGTGGPVQLKDSVPVARQRYYRLQVTSGTLRQP